MTLFRLLSPTTTVLTPNHRLAAMLLKNYNLEQVKTGQHIWPTPLILPYTRWLTHTWEQWSSLDTSPPYLLSSAQERIIWEDILLHSPTHSHLLQRSNAAKVAHAAWGLLNQWCISPNNPIIATTPDGEAFQQWALDFATRCQENNWLDTQRLAHTLATYILNNAVALPTAIILYGFTDLTPQQSYLLERYQEKGCDVITYSAESHAQTTGYIALHDSTAEWRSMARWAKYLLQTNTHVSSLRIGCVIPQLELFRNQIQAIFSDVFSPPDQILSDTLTLPFNISAGQKLNDYPIIYTALQLLNLNVRRFDCHMMSRLLQSPFIGKAETEMLERIRFCQLFHVHNIMHLSLAQLLQPDSNLCLARTCSHLAHFLEQFHSMLATLPAVAPISTWATLFMDLLHAIGWPGERSLNSQEYQVVQAWLTMLQGYQTLEIVLPSLTYTQALHYLLTLTAQTIFQPQSPETPVQILGILEATYNPFDYLWVSGIDDQTWPSAPQPNPFLPASLQKKLNMPHASAEREIQFCQRLTQQLQQSAATTIIFSYAQHTNGTERQPSALLNALPTITLDELKLTHCSTRAEHIFQSKQYETLLDDYGQPLPAQARVLGGTALFKQQAACPFQAFAQQRLRAKAVIAAQLGLRSYERGKLTHTALELIWQQLRDHQTLIGLAPLTLRQQVRQYITQAMAQEKFIHNQTQQYLFLEADRLEKLLLAWLDIEKTREPFTVMHLEHEKEIRFADLTLKVRLDRMDITPSQHRLIIDYKTGKSHHLSDWFSDRPDEPQLPLYYITQDEPIAGLLFAQVNIENMALKGISDIQVGSTAVKSLAELAVSHAKNLTAQSTEWQIILTQLANNFREGYAKVDPKSPETCQHCHLQSVCRIYEK